MFANIGREAAERLADAWTTFLNTATLALIVIAATQVADCTRGVLP